MTNQIIDNLKAEHRVLAEHLNKAKENGYFTPEAREFIFKIEQEFRDHLQKEDEQLYKGLREVAKTNMDTKIILEFFDRELQQVTDDVINFFELHEKDSDHTHFERDIVHLITSVEARITKEEQILYPLYEQLGIGN